MQTFLRCLGRPLLYRTIIGRTGNLHYVTQFGDATFYRWLESVGLMPRKSLVLGAISVPDEHFFDLARGLLDGDGSLLNYWYDGGGKAAGRRYEGSVARFLSASGEHIEWLRSSLRRLAGIRGNVARSRSDPCLTLNYAIRESRVLLPKLYPDESVPKLDRKWMVWKRYADTHGHAATLSSMTLRSA